MATKSPLNESPGPKPPLISPNPITPPVKPELSATDSRDAPTPTALRLPEPPVTSDADVVHIPSYSRWFSWNGIHECEVRFLPEFFDSRSPSKNPRAYIYYRNSIVKQFRENPARKLTFTDVRKTLVGDVGSIRRVFDFLEAWGLVNYSASVLSKPLKWEDKESSKSGGVASQAAEVGGGSAESSAAPNRVSSKRLCNGCKSLCSIACFACEKYDLTLCARCYVRGNYRVGVSCSDFRRVEISEELKTCWTDKETLQLLEGVMYYGDDWKKVAQHVGGRSEKECVAYFIQLPFGEEFAGYLDSGEAKNRNYQMKEHGNAESGLESNGTSASNKRMCLTPLADASNPIMAQAAFLSALAGVEVAEAAAQAAVTKLSELDCTASKESIESLARHSGKQEADVTTNGDTTSNALEGACLEANSLLEKEELDVLGAIAEITEVQMKEIQDKIVRFEELDLQREKEWQQLEQMKDLLFADQLALLFHKSSAPKSGECMEENLRTD